jgi:peroxiredoxin Q/BCP
MATTNMLPVIGKPAPDFSLPSTTGETISLRQYKGKKTVVLYFYPKDETPGCTREACDFRDQFSEFDRHGVVVLGVSTDNLDSHRQFTDKHHLPFTLLSDEDASVSKMYGVFKQKNLYGKKYMGIERTTFVIDRTGRVAQIYPKVKVDGHVQTLLEFVGED